MKKLRKPVKNISPTKGPTDDLEEYLFQKGVEILVGQSGSFQFLHDEEDPYTTTGIKEKY